jgi:radical SAM protein with 4Fe4S-binding SPASM domain
MPLARVAEGLAKVRATNPNAHLVLTGGEPLIHSEIDRVLDLVEAIDLKLTILSNGTHLTAEKAARIKKIPRLRAVQISLDGWSEETHGKSRGRGSFAKVMAGIQNCIDAGVHFILAPTLHSENIHELQAIAEFAISNGGFVSPNNLRHFPHDSNKKAVTADGRKMTPRKAELRNEEVTISPKLVLPNEELMKCLVKVNRALREKFGRERMETLGAQFASTTACSVESPNSRSTCGFGRELIDVDWNGDVYPCHLAKSKELIIGNLFAESFDTILTRTEESGLRVRSYEIPKCSGCKFVSNCGGGCRMGAYFAYGTLKREDDLCEVNYKTNIRKLTMPLRDRDKAIQAGSEFDVNLPSPIEADASL